MFKKILAISLAAVISIGMNTSVYASELPSATTSISALNEKSIPTPQPSAKIQLDSSNVEEITLEVVEFKEQTAVSGENSIIDFSSSQRSNSTISGDVAKVNGTLTTDNTMDVHFFSKTSASTTVSKITSSNAKYALALATVDYALGEITLTDYSVYANQQFAISLPAGDYAWIILSVDKTYGNAYTLCHNSSLPYNTNSVLYLSNDYQKIYTLSGSSLKINNQYKDLSYRYTIDWKNGSSWHKKNIWLDDPNVGSAIHIGGFSYTYGSKTVSYSNAIVFTASTGGTWKHYHDQNPPRVLHNYYDIAGKYTPRAIDSDDIMNLGSHYIVYDLSTDTAKEFVSGLSYEWSKNGDKKSPTLY